MDPETGLARALGRQGSEERFEGMGLEMQRKMRAGFLDLAKASPNRFRVIDGDQQIDDVQKEVRATVTAHLADA